MRRSLALLLSDWPLKLGALGLALALYVGVSLSQNDRTWPGQVPIEILDPPRGGAVLDLPGTVSGIRYRGPLDAAVTLANGSFLASIDLSDVVPTTGGDPVPVPVRVIALDPRIQVIDYTPQSVNVRVDQLVTRPVLITVDRGTVPTDLALGPPVVSPASVVLRGASSRVAAVQSVVARVVVDASGLNIDQDVDLQAIDETGAPVPGVELFPERARVSIDVARELTYATLPVVPVVTGAPAPGYRVAALSVSPTTLTVSGEAAAVTRLSSVPTQPLDISGSTDSLEGTVDPDLAPDVSVVGESTVRIQVAIEADVGSRTWQVGVRPEGARPNRDYALSASTVQVTFSGPLPVLESVDPATIVAAVEVGGLPVGRHEVNVTVAPIENLVLASVAPEAIRVEVARPAATAEPSLSPIPSVVP